MSLLTVSKKGIYCAAGDFYIDPASGVERAVLTHAHSDHARMGSKAYLAHHLSAPVLKHRLGGIALQTVGYGEKIHLNGVEVSLHPAGHVIGSAQVRVAYRGEVWVVSGDYKLEDDGLSGAFEPVPCHVFVSECTFGLPVYRWEPQEQLYEQVNAWWRENRAQGRCSVLVAYSLGKAQRVSAALDRNIGPVYAHTATIHVQEALRAVLPELPMLERVDPLRPRTDFVGSMVLVPQNVVGSSWLKRFEPYELGVCSGWCQVRGQFHRQQADRGFILSDHADWPGLLTAIRGTGASTVYLTHGSTAVMARYLRESFALDAREV
jgi:putative mRNA 3-end processing factor